MSILNVSLPEELKTFVESEVKIGAYSTTSEYVRELIRQAQKKKSNETLESLILAGLNSGKAEEMTEKDWRNIRKKILNRKSR